METLSAGESRVQLWLWALILWRPMETSATEVMTSRQTCDQSSNTNPEYLRSVHGKHLMCFQSENAIFKFLGSSVDGAKFVHVANLQKYFFFLKMR